MSRDWLSLLAAISGGGLGVVLAAVIGYRLGRRSRAREDEPG